MSEINRKKSKRIAYEDRLRIESMLKEGKEKIEIAFIIGVHPATIDRELKRGGYPTYSADVAQKTLR